MSCFWVRIKIFKEWFDKSEALARWEVLERLEHVDRKD